MKLNILQDKMLKSISSKVNKLQQYFSTLVELFVKNKRYILCKYLPTSIMYVLSAYIYSLLRGVKDSILVPELGAELISYIKFYGVFPATIIFFVCFSKLANLLSRDKLYYSITSFFISFFLLYAFTLGPNKEFLHPDLSNWISSFPSFKYQIMMIENWTVSLFYIMSELCGTVMLTLLFWQFANDLYSVKEAKKTYALFGLIGQFGLVVAGFVQSYVSEYFINNYDGNEVWVLTIKWIMISIAGAGICLMLLYHWMYKNVLPNPEFCERKHNAETEKVRLSIKESFKYVFSSRYLWLIMVIVFCYGFGINLIESVWKDQLRLQYNTQNSYSAFMGRFHIYFGFTSMLTMMGGAYILRKFKWLFAALCTPVGAGFSGAIFFTLLIFKDLFEPLLSSFDINVLSMSVMLGSLQVIIFKSFNYTFVDATKEMAFIPLDRELRTKGKAAVDVIGGRFGKSFGAILQQLMFQFISPNLADLTREISLIFVFVMAMWVYSVISLNKRFTQIVETPTKASHKK
jgi:AAA family ATP:ADP antiporter